MKLGVPVLLFALFRNGLAMGQYYHRACRENRKPAPTPRSRLEEPGARDVPARICGGPGWATTQVYPVRAPNTGREAPILFRRIRELNWPLYHPYMLKFYVDSALR